MKNASQLTHLGANPPRLGPIKSEVQHVKMETSVRKQGRCQVRGTGNRRGDNKKERKTPLGSVPTTPMALDYSVMEDYIMPVTIFNPYIYEAYNWDNLTKDLRCPGCGDELQKIIIYAHIEVCYVHLAPRPEKGDCVLKFVDVAQTILDNRRRPSIKGGTK